MSDLKVRPHCSPRLLKLQISAVFGFHGSVGFYCFLFGFGFLFVLGLGRGVGGADGFFPCAYVFVGQIGFVTNMFLAIEKKLSEIGEVFGAAGGDAAVGDEIEQFAEEEVDVGGRAELAGDGYEFLADFFLGEELLLFAGVDQAEGRVGLVTEHAALATVGETELAEFGLDRRRFWYGTAWWNSF